MMLNESQNRAAYASADFTPAVAEFLNTLPMMVRVSDAAGRDLWFSRTWLDFTGHSQEEEIARWTENVHPDDLEAVLDGNRASRLALHLRFRLRRRDGQYRRIACTATPRFSVNGQFLGYIDSCQDIQDLYTEKEYSNLEQLLASTTALLSAQTDRAVRAEADIRSGHDRERQVLSEKTQTERQFQLLVQGITDYAIFLLDPEGNVTTWNPGAQRIKGYTASEIIGRHFSAFYTEEDRAAGKPQEALAAAAREGRFETENWRVRKDGTRFWANVVIDAIRDENGELSGFAKITRDLTERRETQEELNRAREQLFQLQKMESIGQLTGGVAHDFNNLLTIIIGNVDMAYRTLSGNKPGGVEKARRLLGNALAGAKRAASLTQRLLAFARRQPLEPKPIDVNRFIANMGDFLARTLGEQFHIEAVTGGSLWKIEADQAQLESAILNIALNARDAMPEGGKLTIEAANTSLDENYARMNPEISPGQYVAISVTDTGTGMTPDVMSHVFEPFFTTKSAGQGTGLGLAQVYGFVRQSGGNVKIYSEPGEGTMVKIYLPRLIAKNTGEEAPQSETVSGAGGETILVVEDDPAVLDYVTEVLKDLNYQVLQAPEGNSALKILESGAHDIDLLLTDVIMPGMSGRVVADQAKRLKPGIKILFMTGYSQNAIVHQGRLDPGIHLIQKPVTPPELASRVRNLLDQPA
jgi:PAS domain S-box-containing protein